MFTTTSRLLVTVSLLAASLAPCASAQYIWVANAGEDTVSKVDINTNQEVARYATWFTTGTNHINHLGNPWGGAAPSRIAQDGAGNTYVLDRFFTPPLTTAHLPVLLKIAPSGGGLGTTSMGSTPLPMLDTSPTNNHIDPGEAQDVRIAWATEIGTAGTDEGALGRALCIDPNGILWIGMYNTNRYYKVNPATGQMIGGPILTPGHRPYLCQVDVKGKLWSVDEAATLAEIDTATSQVTLHNHATFGNNYSLSLFNGCGVAPSKVYISNRSGKTWTAYDPQATSFNNAPVPAAAQFTSVSVAVDLNGDIVSGEYTSTGRVIKTAPNGAVMWDTNTLPAGPTVPAQDLHGIIVDAHNDVWVVHMRENRVVKYSGVDGHWIATVGVGDKPYTYGNPPPPTCPCAEISGTDIRCVKQSGGTATYSWSFTFTNHSPFSTPATAIDISSLQATNISPAHMQFSPPVQPNSSATVSGTFTVANPMPGMQVCLDIRLNGGDGWCCPVEHVCFLLPECHNCAALQGTFVCQHGHPMLQLSITNQGPTAAQSVTVVSNTPGVTVTPQMTMQNFPQNQVVTIPLTVTGASAGQTISLTVSLHGPINPDTGVYSWCCDETITVKYPAVACNGAIDGWVFNDLDRDGVRDSEESGLGGWTVAFTPGAGPATRTTVTDAGGAYRFEDVPPGVYRIRVQPPKGWRATLPESGIRTVTIGAGPEQVADYGFVQVQP